MSRGDTARDDGYHPPTEGDEAVGMDSTNINEIKRLMEQVADRMRRTETRVTKIANHIGVDAGGESARWADGRVEVPSPMCSLKECIATVPSNWPKEDYVEVYVRSATGRTDFMMAFTTA